MLNRCGDTFKKQFAVNSAIPSFEENALGIELETQEQPLVRNSYL